MSTKSPENSKTQKQRKIDNATCDLHKNIETQHKIGTLYMVFMVE